MKWSGSNLVHAVCVVTIKDETRKTPQVENQSQGTTFNIFDGDMINTGFIYLLPLFAFIYARRRDIDAIEGRCDYLL